jgi:hypothetical protein
MDIFPSNDDIEKSISSSNSHFKKNKILELKDA